MIKNKSLLILLIAAIALLAAPALAQNNSVKKLVVRNNLKNGRQFEAVFEPGTYVLHGRTANFPYGIFGLHVVSDPAPACFIRSGHQGNYSIDRLILYPNYSHEAFFEVKDTCYLRFEIRNYHSGAVNIRKVKKIKTLHLTTDWQEVTFGPGRWSGTALNGAFYAEIQAGNDSKSCSLHTGSDGMEYGIYQYSVSPEGKSIGHTYSFILDEACVMNLRGAKKIITEDEHGKSSHLEPTSLTATFAKSA